MLSMRTPAMVVLAASLLTCFPATVNAQGLQQLSDAYADVVTFGAWGQSRDLHAAEMELLRKRHELEMQRLKNFGEAAGATQTLKAHREAAIEFRNTGQKLLKVVALIDVIQGELKSEIAARFKQNTDLRRFDEWFDSFVTGSSNEIQQLTNLIAKTTKLKDEDLEEVLKAAKIASVTRESEIREARLYLAGAVKASRWQTLEKAVGALVDIRRLLTELIERQRMNVREWVSKMHAEDVKRRTLCDPNPVAITCDLPGGKCRYHNAGNAPCNDLVFINVLPVAFVKDILDNSDSYRRDVEFFIDLARIGEVGDVLPDAYLSPRDVFAKALVAKPLIPADFAIAKPCRDVTGLKRRLLEAIDFAQMLRDKESLSKSAGERIEWLKNQRFVLDFVVSGLESVASPATGCSGISDRNRAKLELLAAAVIATETFGSAITFGDGSEGVSPELFKPIEALTAAI